MSACTTAGVALGFIVGGTLGDLLSYIMPDYARPAVNQVPLPVETDFCILALPAHQTFLCSVALSLYMHAHRLANAIFAAQVFAECAACHTMSSSHCSFFQTSEGHGIGMGVAGSCSTALP